MNDRLLEGARGSDNKDDECGFEDLPIEVLASLFCYLDESSKRTARLVSSDWKLVLDTYFLKFTANLTDDNYENILNSTVQFNTILVKNFIRDVNDDLRSRLNLSALNVVFRQKSILDYSEDAPSPSVTPANVLKILKINTGMKNLVFEKNTLSALEFPEMDDIRLENLTSLEINITEDKNVNEKIAIRSLSRIQMPSVSNLNISVKIESSTIYDTHAKQRFYYSLFEFVAKFKGSLKILRFFNTFDLLSPPSLRIVRLGTPEPLPTSSWQMPPDQLTQLKENLSEIQLHEFSFLFSKQEGCSNFDLGFHLLHNQNNLTKLDFHFSPVNPDLFLLVEQTVVQCSQTLDSVGIINQGFCILPLFVIESILTSLITCSALKMLTLNGFHFDSLLNICPPLKIHVLEVNGRFEPNVLTEIATLFLQLEHLFIFHNDIVEPHHHSELTTNLKTMVRTMSRLTKLAWKLQNFDLNFLNDEPFVKVTLVHQLIDYYSVCISKNIEVL